MHENPSAGKFEPPERQAPDTDRSGSPWLLIALLIASSYPLMRWLLSIRGYEWLTAVAAVVAFALGVADYAVRRRNTDPFSPPSHLTR